MSEMRLSEAIRIGAMLKPQGRYGFSQDKSCALKAAADAISHGDGYRIDYTGLAERWPVLLMAADPPVPLAESRVMQIIWVLNDSRRWTREAIADWVETLESARQQAPALAPTGDAVAGALA